MKRLLLFALILASCTSTRNEAKIHQGLGGIPTQFSDAETIEEIRKLHPQATYPLTIAVMPSRNGRGAFTMTERTIIKKWEQELINIGFVDRLQIIPQSLMPTHSYRTDKTKHLNQTRIAAARLQADAILFLNDSTVTGHSMNPLSIFNLTIVGMWLAPAHHRDSYSVFEASLFDVNNGYLYAIAEGHGQHKTVRPLVYADHALGQEDAKEAALTALGTELIKIARLTMAVVEKNRTHTSLAQD